MSTSYSDFMDEIINLSIRLQRAPLEAYVEELEKIHDCFGTRKFMERSEYILFMERLVKTIPEVTADDLEAALPGGGEHWDYDGLVKMGLSYKLQPVEIARIATESALSIAKCKLDMLPDIQLSQSLLERVGFWFGSKVGRYWYWHLAG